MENLQAGCKKYNSENPIILVRTKTKNYWIVKAGGGRK
jgi:hypothetical protein